ncbi:hypothetical protein P8452_10799 [Trifolium repens]|nr:hypothetical protein P8452_10799 [Trifolium repens]
MIRLSSLPPQPPPPPPELHSSSSQSGGRVRFLCKTTRNKNRSLGQNGRWVFFKARGFRYYDFTYFSARKHAVRPLLDPLSKLGFQEPSCAHDSDNVISIFYLLLLPFLTLILINRSARYAYCISGHRIYLASKLSKRKVDDSLHMLHSILFGKKSKTHNLNRNIDQFSDYVWAENECSSPAAVAASVGESGLLDKDQKRDKDT